MVETDALRQWAVGLIICALGGTVISLLSPRGSMEKTLRAVIGIFVVSALCIPFMKMKKTDTLLPAFVVHTAPEIQMHNLNGQMVKACENTVGEVVDEVLESVGAYDYTVETNVDIDKENRIIIQDIQITVSLENDALIDEIQAELSERLGVPVTVICE